MSLTFIRSAAGAALLAVLAAGCGTAATAQHAATKPAAAAQPRHSAPAHAPVTTPTPPPATTAPATRGPAPATTRLPRPPIPSRRATAATTIRDNNGGPSDGDGNI